MRIQLKINCFFKNSISWDNRSFSNILPPQTSLSQHPTPLDYRQSAVLFTNTVSCFVHRGICTAHSCKLIAPFALFIRVLLFFFLGPSTNVTPKEKWGGSPTKRPCFGAHSHPPPQSSISTKEIIHTEAHFSKSKYSTRIQVSVSLLFFQLPISELLGFNPM